MMTLIFLLPKGADRGRSAYLKALTMFCLFDAYNFLLKVRLALLWDVVKLKRVSLHTHEKTLYGQNKQISYFSTFPASMQKISIKAEDKCQKNN